MKILLDNCVHRRVETLFPSHEVQHASKAGLARLRNGELLREASSRFELLVTTDKNIRHQHNLEQLPIAVLELNMRLTRWADLAPLAPFLETALQRAGRFAFVSVAPHGNIETLAVRRPST